MSLNESQIQNAPQTLACQQCGFQNFGNDPFCQRCHVVLGHFTNPASRLPTQGIKIDMDTKVLNVLDFLFIMMSMMGMYWYYFDRNGARTLAQKQFRIVILLAGSVGMLVVWMIKLARKKSA
jgi:hypothetical protein